jgi:DNA-binding CsgD family transcriptional regulator
MPRKKKSSTWLNYIENCTSKDLNPLNIQIDDKHPIFQINQYFQNMFHYIVPAMYLLDYTTGKYLIMSKTAKTILGYDADNFIDEGVGFTIDIYNKQDLRLFNEQIFPDRLDVLRGIPPEDHHKYIFSYNYRTFAKNGQSVNLLQRNCFIKSDENGNPLLSLGIVTNTDHFKSETPVIQVVDKLDESANGLSENVFKKIYYPNAEDKLFSRREKEVLLMCADGLTSKAIAEKLHISENTVINHRRNMQAKSGAGNMAELIKFAIRNHII